MWNGILKKQFFGKKNKKLNNKNKITSVLTICFTNDSMMQNIFDYIFFQGALKTKECMYIECMHMPVYKTQNK